MTSLSQKLALKIAALLGALAVGLGAFGAHALKGFLVQHGHEETWKTAVLYHLAHAVVLLVLATAKEWRPRPWLAIAAGTSLFRAASICFA